jgi:hypothetical protein
MIRGSSGRIGENIRSSLGFVEGIVTDCVFAAKYGEIDEAG